MNELEHYRKLIKEIVFDSTSQENIVSTSVSGLTFIRFDEPTKEESYILSPNICIILQGRKTAFLGKESYVYDSSSMLVSAFNAPIVSRVHDIEPAAPYLGLTVALDLELLAEITTEESFNYCDAEVRNEFVTVVSVSSEILSSIYRLSKLSQNRENSTFLQSNIKKELYYHLLCSEQGHHLRRIVTRGSNLYKVSKAAKWIKDNHAMSFKMEDLALQAGMSLSSFNKCFKSITYMSALQYQKRIRLNEARKLILSGLMDAQNAAFSVGYESPSQFSREYSREFGLPPLKDFKELAKKMPD